MGKQLSDYLYYEEKDPDIKIYCGDNLEIMPLLDPCDMVLTSPPYNFGDGGLGNKGYEDDKDQDTYFTEQSKLNQLALGNSKYLFYNTQMLAGNKDALFKIIGAHYDSLKEIFIWDKINAEPAMSEGVLNSQFEFILVFSRDKKRKFDECSFKRGTLSNVIRLGKNTENRYSEFHSAAMPILLPKKIMNGFLSSSVLDPYLGTGTTLVACKEMKRSGVGIEINPKYCEIAKNRLKNTQVPFL